MGGKHITTSYKLSNTCTLALLQYGDHIFRTHLLISKLLYPPFRGFFHADSPQTTNKAAGEEQPQPTPQPGERRPLRTTQGRIFLSTACEEVENS